MTLRYKYINLAIIFLSVCLFSVGQGLLSTVIVIKLTPLKAGLITSILYIGMTIGAYQSSAIIDRLDRIKVYAAFIVLLSATNFLFAISNNTLLWYVLRFLCGYNIAIVYIITESLILHISNNRNRGRYLGAYGISVYGIHALSQLLLKVIDIHSIQPFIIAGTFTLIATIPLLLTKLHVSKQIKKPLYLSIRALYNSHPISIISAITIGVLIASMYGLFPVYIRNIGFNINDTAFLMFLTIGGSVVLRYFMGYLSDILNRSIMLALLFIALSILSTLMLFLFVMKINTVLAIGSTLFILGGLIFSIYPISMAYLCDRIGHEVAHIKIVQSVFLSFCFGLAFGPIITASSMYFLGSSGLFSSFTIITAIIGIVLISKIIKGKLITNKKACDNVQCTSSPQLTNVKDS